MGTPQALVVEEFSMSETGWLVMGNALGIAKYSLGLGWDANVNLQ